MQDKEHTSIHAEGTDPRNVAEVSERGGQEALWPFVLNSVCACPVSL